MSCNRNQSGTTTNPYDFNLVTSTAATTGEYRKLVTTVDDDAIGCDAHVTTADDADAVRYKVSPVDEYGDRVQLITDNEPLASMPNTC